MFTPLLLSVLVAGGPEKDLANALERIRRSPALDLTYELVVRATPDGAPERIAAEAHGEFELGSPFAGSGKVTGDGKTKLVFVGDGQRWAAVDHEAQTYQPLADDCSDSAWFPRLYPIATWASASAQPPKGVTAIEGQGDGLALSLKFDDHTEDLHFGPEGGLHSAAYRFTTRSGGRRHRVVYEYRFERWSLRDDVDPSERRVALPAQYDEIGPDWDYVKTLIKRGQPAPDISLVDLSGQPVQLSDYVGQTVVLNFWFYH